MKRLGLRDWLLLILPAIVLAGAALYWQKRESIPKTDPGFYRLVISKVERQKVTPREAFLGYDTKIVVTTQRKGNLPPFQLQKFLGSKFSVFHPKLVTRKGQKWLASSTTRKGEEKIACLYDFFFKESIDKQTQSITFLLKLRKIQPNPSQLRIQCSFTQNYAAWAKLNGVVPPGAKVSMKSGAYNIISFVTPPTAFDFVVRKKGEQTQSPRISQTVPIVATSSDIKLQVPSQGLSPQGYINVNKDERTKRLEVTVKGKFYSLDNIKNPDWFVDDSYLEDEKGRKYYRFRDKLQPKHPKIKVWTTAAFSGSETPIPARQTNRLDASGYIFTFRTDISRVPTSAGRLTLKASVSFNGAWPLKISQVVRTQAECGVKPSLISLQNATYEETPNNDRIVVSLKYHGNLPLILEDACDEAFYNETECHETTNLQGKVRLISDWWGYVEDAQGNILNTYIPGKAQYRYGIYSAGGSYDALLKTCVVNFYISNTALPKKPLYCVLHIGVEGDNMLRVRVPILIKK